MLLRTGLAAALALLATFGASAMPAAAPAPTARAANDELRALDGTWIFVEDRTEGRPLEEQQPPMSTRLQLRVEADAVVLVRSDGEVRMPLDGSTTDVAREGGTSRYSGTWKESAFAYEIGLSSGGRILTELRPTGEGLLARVEVEVGQGMKSLALYRHPEDIAMPEPAKATIGDLEWLAGAWVGTAGKSSIEERWSPPRGGAMLGVSRTVSRERMVAFEFLRVVQRDGGLVYKAQPGGAPPTEFVLTELDATRAVFENPRHDFPQRITYELADDGRLTASIGFTKGGRPQRFEYTREEG